jgi:RNA methyltransferase, TrmH family
MLPKSLISLQHPFVKYLVKIRKERSFRRNEGKVLVTGKKLILELIEKKAPIELLLLTEKSDFSSSHKTVKTTPEILQKITGFSSLEGMAALLAIPPFQKIEKAKNLLVLDGVTDPGNLGTLLRSALSFGWDGIYLTENTCDPFNDKALRAAKGATFFLPMEEGSFANFLKIASSFTVLVADMEGTPVHLAKKDTPLALILSAEGAGARQESKETFQKVKVPMFPSMESLNVASAGAILLYTLKGGL